MTAMKVIALFGLICLSFSAAEVKLTYNKHGHLDDFSTNDQDRNLFSYIECEKASKSSKHTKCKVTQEVLDGKYKATTCDVMLDNHLDDGYVILRNFGKDRVIITWWSESDENNHQFIRNTIVQLTDCKTAEANVGVKDREASEYSWNQLHDAFLVKDDTFDVFYYKQREIGDRLRKVTFNAQGNMVGKPIKWLYVPEEFEKLSIHPIDNNLYVTKWKLADGRIELGLLNRNGTRYNGFDVHADIVAFASNNNTMVECYAQINSKKVECFYRRFLSDKAISRITIEVDHPVEKVFDLACFVDDEFLLVTHDEQDNYISKYGFDGKLRGRVNLPNLKCKGPVKEEYSIYSSGNQECIVRSCIQGKEYDVINYCFSAQDFK